jgi:hypothetical protein
MGMTKEQQRSAAERILGKEPLDEYGVERLKYWTMEIEDYPAPSPEKLRLLANYLKG